MRIVGRIAYGVMGTVLGLTLASFYLNYNFNNAFSRISGRVYQLGCAQGMILAVGYDQPKAFSDCEPVGKLYEETLKTVLDQ